MTYGRGKEPICSKGSQLGLDLDRGVVDAERGEACYHEALALAEPRGMRPLVAHCHLGLGKLYRRTNSREQAQEHLRAATTMYREMDMPFWLEQATQIDQLG